MSRRSAGKEKAPDPREAFSINKWPSRAVAQAVALPPVLCENRAMIHSFQLELHAFALQLLDCVASALDLPLGHFASQHIHSEPNFDNFELMHYPALDRD